MTTTSTIDTVYGELLTTSTNSRQRESLERIKQACDYLEEQGLRISPSTIERYCVERDWSGPKAQSIRNSKEVLHRYVELRKSGQKMAVHRNKVRAEPLIADETIRAYVQLLKEERDQAVAARNRIEAGLRLIPGIPVDDLIRVGLGGRPALETSKKEAGELPLTAREAIALLFQADHIHNCGLQLYKDRLRQAITGNVLLEKQHVLALRSLISEIAHGDGNA